MAYETPDLQNSCTKIFFKDLVIKFPQFPLRNANSKTRILFKYFKYFIITWQFLVLLFLNWYNHLSTRSWNSCKVMYVRQGEFSTSAQTFIFNCRKHLILTLQLFTIRLRFLCWFNLLTMTSHKQPRVGVCRIEWEAREGIKEKD